MNIDSYYDEYDERYQVTVQNWYDIQFTHGIAIRDVDKVELAMSFVKLSSCDD